MEKHEHGATSVNVASMAVRDRSRSAPELTVISKPKPRGRSRRSQRPASVSFSRSVSRPQHKEKRSVLGIGERLLRDAALCTAALLCMLALGNINHPLAQQASSTVRDMVTMDLDESLGKLQFVRNILPESALVFWDVGTNKADLQAPAQGDVLHAWHAAEPWLEYDCVAQDVLSAAQGEVMSVVKGQDGGYLVRVRHENDMETLYGYLTSCLVAEGDTLLKGQTLGKVADSLFFEVRQAGRSVNPAEVLASR